MATLTKQQRSFIVRELACYSTPSEVVEAVNERFGIEVSRQQVQHYDPTVGRDPADKWRRLFREARDAFVEDTARHGIAHRNFRLRELDRMYRKAKRMKNYALAAEILEQAAKEVGEKFTNLQILEHSGRDGEPIKTKSDVDLTKMATEDLQLLKQLKERAGVTGNGARG